MKTLFAYFPTGRKEYLCLSQNRFSKYRKDPEMIYPLVPASGVTLWKNEGYEVKFIDSVCEGLSEEQFLEKVERFNPDLIVFETKTPVVKQNWKTVDKIKELLPKVKIAAVGDHVSVLPEETIKNSKVDFVLTGGDFDISMLKLAKSLEGKSEMPKGCYYRGKFVIKNTGNYELIENLDEVPFIDREILNWRDYHEGWCLTNELMYLLGSRGCPYKCTFCSWPQMLYNGRIRFRSIKNVLDEIEELEKKYNPKEYFFDDDTFTCNKKWVLDFCNGLKERNLKIIWSCNGRVDNTDEEMLKAMKESGCRLIKYGVESVSQGTLDRIKKGYSIEQVRGAFKLSKKYGILRHATAMIGYPWESKEVMLKTIDFVKSLDTDTCQFSIPIVYPGTALFKEAEEKNWLIFGKDWERYDMSLPTLKHPNLKPEEIVELCELGWKRIYFSPKFIMRKALSMKNPKQTIWIFKGIKTVFSDIISLKINK